jgi:hypothetical protein
MKTIKIIFLIFLTSILITECSKDENDGVETGKGTGNLTIKGIVYEMAEGIVYKNTESAGPPYNFDIDLISSPTNDGIGAETCHLVAMEMYTASKDDLQAGTYSYDEDGTSHAGTFSGLIAIDINKETEESSYFYVIKSGTVLVNRSDAGYEITIDVVTDKYEYEIGEDDFVITESDVEIACYYKGSLKKSEH